MSRCSLVPWSVVVIAAVMLAAIPAALAEAADAQPLVGHRAPDFTLKDASGRPVRLSEVLAQKAVLLNFWATWCPPCREEMPSMERVYRDYRVRGFEVLAVSLDLGTEASVTARVSAFMAELGLTFPALLDLAGEATRAYRIRALPVTFLIDRHGWVRALEIGPRDWSSPDARAQLEGLLQ
jgi:peroxiredoxin